MFYMILSKVDDTTGSIRHFLRYFYCSNAKQNIKTTECPGYLHVFAIIICILYKLTNWKSKTKTDRYNSMIDVKS